MRQSDGHFEATRQNFLTFDKQKGKRQTMICVLLGEKATPLSCIIEQTLCLCHSTFKINKLYSYELPRSH